MKRNKIVLTPVEELPKEHRCDSQHNIFSTLNQFMESDHRIVKVELSSSDYDGCYAAYSAFRRGARAYKLPVKVCIRNGGLYLIKKDIV
jgi:hypothetical protein